MVDGVTIYYRGKRILDALLDYLCAPEYGLTQATEVLMSGGSAGGLSVFLHADYVRSRVGQDVVKFAAAPVSGFFLMHDSVNGTDEYPARMHGIYDMMNSSGGVNQRCLAALGPANGWKCIFANYGRSKLPQPVVYFMSAAIEFLTM